MNIARRGGKNVFHLPGKQNYLLILKKKKKNKYKN